MWSGMILRLRPGVVRYERCECSLVWLDMSGASAAWCG